jgi:histidine triad (HIT) family protein
MSHEPSCVFCKIVRGELPAATVLETDEALAFLDIGPLKPGHTLLIPKAHHESLPEMPDDLAAATAALLPRLCRAVKAATQAEGLNVLANTGPVAGQSVNHVHWHIIPRHGGDAIRWPWVPGRYADADLAAMRAAVARALGADS